MIKIKRVYDRPEKSDGERYLVDRLWPRGVKKDSLEMRAWLKDVSPSNELRKQFGHDPEHWPEFQRRYFHDLDAEPQAWQPLLEAAQSGDITLLYSARDTERNNAVALREYLERKLAQAG